MMHIETNLSRPNITFAQMRRFLTIGWGTLGEDVAATWLEFNRQHFGGKLHPLPITIVSTSPYGHWLGLTYGGADHNRTHLIQLTMPRNSSELVADRGVLLHEMVHQHLIERGESPKHEHGPWCREIMRLHLAITGKRIWAAPEVVGKRRGENGERKSIRYQPICPETGMKSIPRGKLSRWPHACGLDLGPLFSKAT